MAITSVTNPRWVDEAQTLIDCDVTTDATGNVVFPYTANKNDLEPSGRLIFELCVAGEFGEIAAYVPPPPEPVKPVSEVKAALG